MSPEKTILFIGLLLSAGAAGSAADLNSPTPEVFNEETAMRAIYGDYNVQRKGTVVEAGDWGETLATAILVKVYVEASVKKGVLVAQRESFDRQGRSTGSHAEGADISVYIFRHDGARWVFEKGRKTVTNAGAFGQAPEARLIRLGDEKYGLLFEPHFQQMGYLSTDIFIVGLSEPAIGIILPTLDMSGDNLGSDACIPEEEAQEPDPAKCWEYKGELNFFKTPGVDYYIIEHRLAGRTSKEAGLISMDGIKYYEKSAGGYQLAAAQKRPDTAPLSLEQVLVP